jgi:hypothetical protein
LEIDESEAIIVHAFETITLEEEEGQELSYIYNKTNNPTSMNYNGNVDCKTWKVS